MSNVTASMPYSTFAAKLPSDASRNVISVVRSFALIRGALSGPDPITLTLNAPSNPTDSRRFPGRFPTRHGPIAS